jgi:ubiquinone/menaquinone biosynthesis C-methylase UbiE
MASVQARTWRSRVKETLDYAAWAYLPLSNWTTTRLYGLLGTNTVAKHGLYINLGYWKDAPCVDQACVAMVQLLAETIQLAADDVVLDVGFGFGEQDLYWMERFGPRRIVGINIVPSQVVAARRRLKREQMADRIQLHLGSATDLPFEAECFTAITALECGFHFDTRERFFQDAYRVLRPGGRLVLSDIIPIAKPRSWQQRWHRYQSWQAFHRTWASPPANAYPRADYARKLTAAGFVDVRVESIRNNVFPAYHAYCTTHPEYLKRFNPVIRLHHWLARLLGVEVVYGAFDYVIGVAAKA